MTPPEGPAEPGNPQPRRPGISTRAIHSPEADAVSPPLGTPVSLPLIQTSTFSFENPEEMISVFEGRRPGFVYSRYGNPTVRVVERKLAALEGGDLACLFASGLAAIHAVLWCTLERGRVLLTGRDLYGGTVDLMSRLLPRLGVELRQIDMADPGHLDRALAGRPAAVYFETPTNPLVRVIDGQRVTLLAHEAGARVIVDNTFATPVLQNPLSWGADYVIHSATKYLGGHSDLVLGAVVGRGPDESGIETTRRSLGAAPDPFAAWLLNRGLMTLAVRVRAQSATAAILARTLERHPKIERVHYPGLGRHPGHDIAARQMLGFGAVLALDLAGGREAAMSFMRGLRMIKLSASLGGVETLAMHPATSSHRTIPADERAALGIGEGLVRLSIGLEEADDLLADIDGGLRGDGGDRR